MDLSPSQYDVYITQTLLNEHTPAYFCLFSLFSNTNFKCCKVVLESIHCISGVPFFILTLSSHTKALAWVQQLKTQVLRVNHCTKGHG